MARALSFFIFFTALRVTLCRPEGQRQPTLNNDHPLAANVMKRLEISEESIAKIIQEESSGRTTLPDYMVKLYEMYENMDDDELKRRGIYKDFTSHMLKAHTWQVESEEVKGHYTWSSKLGRDIIAYAEIVSQLSTSCLQANSVPARQLTQTAQVQLCSNVHGCVTEAVQKGSAMHITSEQAFLSFNITALLDQWLQKKENEHDVHFNVHLRLREPHLKNCVTSSVEPIIVLHTEPETNDFEADIENVIMRGQARRPHTTSVEHQLADRARRAVTIREELCKRHEWRVSFVDLNWHTWIIQPQNFDASVCKGDCLSDDSPITGHAFLRMVFKQKINSQLAARLPLPVCAATQMASMSLLFLDVDKTVTVKRMTDMVIETCACI